MGHNIWIDKANKAHAAYAIEAAWHKLGTVIPHLMTAEETMKAAGLDWPVEKRQLCWNGKEVDAYGVFRTTDDEMLGVVSDFYKVIQNAQAFDFSDALVEAVGGAHYEAAGALGKGEMIWTLVRVPLEMRIAGTDDKHEIFLLFTTRHDGKGAAIAKLTGTRVVCQNTLNMALEGAGQFCKVAHFGDVTKKLDAAQKLMSQVTGQVQSLEQKLNILAQRKMDKPSFLAVLDKLYPPPASALAERSAALQAQITIRENKLAQIAGLYESNDKNAFPEIRGTAYNLLNAVVEYTDHYAGTDAARPKSAMFGAGDSLKQEALEVILETTAGNATKQVLYSKPAGKESSLLDDVVAATPTKSKSKRSN